MADNGRCRNGGFSYGIDGIEEIQVLLRDILITLMIKNGDIYYRCLVDMQPILSSSKLGDLMRVAEHVERHPSADETSEMDIVECTVGEKGCRPIKTLKVSKKWSVPPTFYELMDFGAKHVGSFASLGKWYNQQRNKDNTCYG